MINITSASPDDAERLLSIYAPYVTNTAITFEYDVPSKEEFARRIENTLRRYPYLVLKRDGDILGYAYAGVLKDRAAYDRSCELSIYLREDAHRQGCGRMLYDALESRLADMGILNLYACIAYPHEEDEYLTYASVRFHERLGFSIVGRFHDCGCKFGNWYDMVWMEKLIGAHINKEDVSR